MRKPRERTLEEILADQEGKQVAEECIKPERFSEETKSAIFTGLKIGSGLVGAGLLIYFMAATPFLNVALKAISVIIVAGIYFLPTIIAYRRDHHQLNPILLINLFLGWSIIGWFGALVWSVSAVKT